MNRTEHLLTILSEECSEVQVRVSKALRFGLYETEPGQPADNVARIQEELGDLFGVLELLQAEGLPLAIIDRRRIEAKKIKVAKFMAYAIECGTLA